jgi:hypothetical protein
VDQPDGRGDQEHRQGEQPATRSSSASTCDDSTTDTPSAAIAVFTKAMKSCRATAAPIEIPQRAAKQRHDAVLVQARRVGGGQPAEQGLVQPGEFREPDLTERGLDERALPGSANSPLRSARVLALIARPTRSSNWRPTAAAQRWDSQQRVAGLRFLA